MTREEAIGKWIYPAIATMWNEKKCKEILEALEQEHCENAISRQAVLDIVDSYSESQSNVEDVTQDIISDIVVLPSVTPKPKTGHWIEDEDDMKWTVWCSECHEDNDDCSKYCPNCGAKMVESRESEDEECTKRR